MKTRKGVSSSKSAKENQMQSAYRIRKGLHITPSISYSNKFFQLMKCSNAVKVMKRAENPYETEALFLNNQITVDSLCPYLSDPSIKRNPMRFWKRMNLAYKIHGWKRPNRLLIYRHAGVPIENLKYTAENLAKFRELRRLNVKFLNLYGTSALELHTFSLKIPQLLPRLRHLSLVFHNCLNITSDTVINLGSNIGDHLAHLESLELSFGKLQSSAGFNDSSLKLFGQKLFSKIRNIHSLEISFYSCDSITDNAFETLVHQIKYLLCKLKVLNLTMHGCKKITDKGVQALKDGIVKYPAKLEHLNLNFSNTDVTDEIFKVVISMMSHLSGLQHLELCLCSCSNISDRGLDTFKQARDVSGFHQLKSFVMWFALSENISKRALSKLPSALRFITKVELPLAIKINPEDFTFSFH